MKNNTKPITFLRLIFGLAFIVSITTGQSADLSIKTALTFYASFDHGTDADIARGDKRLFTLIDKKPKPGNKRYHCVIAIRRTVVGLRAVRQVENLTACT